MNEPLGVSVRRKAEKLRDQLMRRAGILPGGVPDGLGQDAQLAGKVLPHTVMVYFADTIGSLYQIEQWYKPFRALDKRHRVVVVMKDSRTAKHVRADSGLDTLIVAEDATMDGLIERSDVKVTLYVNHNPENFAHLRFTSMVHASLMHGDSDKGVTVSNQTKAYDFSLVAGQAAVDRMAAFSTFYDAQTRCIPIGRPQLDDQAERRAAAEAQRLAGGPPSALYAPTWEGPQPSAAYGSIDTHGRRLVGVLIDAGWRVIYRPHPLSGIRSPEYGEADEEIRQMILAAESADPRGHRTDTAPDVAQAFADADVMVCDVSGVAMDWLPSLKPLVITRPANPAVSVAVSPLTELAPGLAIDQVDGAPGLLTREVDVDPGREQRAELVEYYLGDVTPGASLDRFLAAVDTMIAVREAAEGLTGAPSQRG